MNYAQINRTTFQMVGMPQELPTSFTSEDGVVVDGLNKLSDDLLFAFGWVPVVVDDITNHNDFYINPVPEYDSGSRAFRMRAISTDMSEALKQANMEIDIVIDDIRNTHMTPEIANELGFMEQSAEYKEALDSGIDPKDDDYPNVKWWAEECGMSVREKALDILTKHSEWMQLMVKVKDIRSVGERDWLSKNTHAGIMEAANKCVLKLREL